MWQRNTHVRLRRSVRLVPIAAIVLIAATSLAACGASGGSGGSSSSEGVTKSAIKIGTTNPVTGPVASACKPVSDGSQAWFRHVNATGGVYGRKIQEHVLDDANTASKAVTNAHTFVSEQDFAVFGGCGSFQPPAMIPILKSANIPYLFPDASAPAVPTDDPLVYGIFPSYSSQLVSAWNYASQAHGPGSAVFFTENFPGEKELVAAVKGAVTKSGGKYLGTVVAPYTAPSYTSYMLKIKSMHPDYVFMQMAASQSAQAVKAMQATGAFPKKLIIGDSVHATNSFLSGVGNLVDGKMIMTSPTALPSSPGAAGCNSVLEKANIAPGGFSMFGCAAAQAFVKALKQTGKSPTREKLMKVLDSWKHVTASPALGPITFSPRDHLGVTKVYIAGVRNGQNYQIKTVDVG